MKGLIDTARCKSMCENLLGGFRGLLIHGAARTTGQTRRGGIYSPINLPPTFRGYAWSPALLSAFNYLFEKVHLYLH